MRVAAVDLGTNSTRLLVADVADGGVGEVVRRLTITRLGEGVDADRRLRPAAISRVSTCLAAYAREADDLGAERRLAIATSAIRDASNGSELLEEVESRHGFATRLLTGEDEADMMFRGVSSDRRVAEGTLLVDIGGGSTELVLGSPGGVASAESLQIGCVRLTERFLHGDPPSRDELAACAAYARGRLPVLRPRSAVGVAGTVTTLAALDLGLGVYDPARIHRHRISRAAVEQQRDRLAGLTLAERERIPGVEPGRAAVIVAGAVILTEVLAAYGLAEIEASERDILDGAALAAAALTPLR